MSVPIIAPSQSLPLIAGALRQALLADCAQALTRPYHKGFLSVRRHIGRRGGLPQDVQDVQQDALVTSYEQATGGSLVDSFLCFILYLNHATR